MGRASDPYSPWQKDLSAVSPRSTLGTVAQRPASKAPAVDWRSYTQRLLPHLEETIARNEKAMRSVVDDLVAGVCAGQSLFVFGSGHSALFALELYHRAGGASFVIPVIGDYLMPSAGPQIVRAMERTAHAADSLLRRAEPRRGEMVWIASQSGINTAVVDFALEAKRLGLKVVAFTSLVHSRGVASRHPSGKRLFEVADEVMDLGGVVGDAVVPVAKDVTAGPLSGITAIALGHSLLVAACARLEETGVRCVYTSVNTSEGEARNQELEKKASTRDPLLR